MLLITPQINFYCNKTNAQHYFFLQSQVDLELAKNKENFNNIKIILKYQIKRSQT